MSRWLLGSAQRPLLDELAAAKSLLAFDFDGTLAPTVRRPQDARLPPTTRRLLSAVARRYPCVVVSGRAREDVAARLSGIPLREVLGNHGIEPSAREGALRRQVAGWVEALSSVCARFPGVRLEDKGLSLTVHLRGCARPQKAHRALRELARAQRGLRWLGGLSSVNWLPRGAGDKGVALARSRRRWRAERALYVGDEDTDEDAFSLAREGWLIAARVGRRRGSLAPFHLRAQKELDEVLRRLLRLREDR